MRKWKPRFKRKSPVRYQCSKCLRTFYKRGVTYYDAGFDMLEFYCCPYCNGGHIEV